MKKQNPNNKLAFNKVAVTELNTQQLKNVNGGVKGEELTDPISGCFCVPVSFQLTIIKQLN
ncbi:hypothetical protein GON26_19485 [Flavobacterium sp. GA093]|uniref:Uncharacterized protein n=1 Tax=Flavobacterium hydrocarbonoxydans TaxID=2683249 RepID=A0A6I4NQR7_9FLAO|nr:class I lanthipeptide [Flavobacterium hydrocarbonoxydans]MWB96553.1 hypothetical protein [Flavobacterium hydrocarbonoxydans]